ncbi:MAG: hypothetical protein ABIY48_10250 [Acidimicrobiales bacterium]
MDNHTPDNDAAKAKVIWSRLGGQLGVGLCALGFLLVFLGWNGAASVDRVPSQFPYLLSGGVAGLCFVVLVVGMLVVQNQRADRAALQATLRELQESLERVGLAQGTGDQRKPFAKPGPRPVVTPAAAVAEVPEELTQEIALPELDAEPAPTEAATPRARRSRSTKS